MRRSRRSLWLLLAVMVFSLGFLRLTTAGPIGSTSPVSERRLSPVQSDRAARRHAHFWQKQCVGACHTLLRSPRTFAKFCRRSAAFITGPRTGIGELLNGLAAGASGFQSSHKPCDALQAACPDVPAAISLIVVIRCQQCADSIPRRTGWSGCDAYAFGCDHFGRTIDVGSLSVSGHPHRVLLTQLGRLVGVASLLTDRALSTIQDSGRPLDRLAKSPL